MRKPRPAGHHSQGSLFSGTRSSSPILSAMSAPPSYFVFRPKAPVRDEFRRVLRALARQILRITGHARTAASDIHEARILIKRLQALLWFAKPAIPFPIVQGIKRELHRASSLLADTRDTKVFEETLQRCLLKSGEQFEIDSSNSQNGHSEAGPEDLTLITDEALKLVQRQIEILLDYSKSVAHWPSLTGRVKRAHRNALRARRKALKSHTPRRLHAWRRKVKRLLYQLQLARRMHLSHFSVRKIDHLQERLGHYHDLVMARERIESAVHGKRPDHVAKAILHRIKKRRSRLARRIFRSAEAIDPHV